MVALWALVMVREMVDLLASSMGPLTVTMMELTKVQAMEEASDCSQFCLEDPNICLDSMNS